MSKKRIGAQTGKKMRGQILFPCAGSGGWVHCCLLIVLTCLDLFAFFAFS